MKIRTLEYKNTPCHYYIISYLICDFKCRIKIKIIF